MNYSTYRFTLDLRKHESQMSIAVFTNDTAVRLCISLTDGGIPYHVGEGCRAVLYGKRPDDSPLINNCMIDDTGRIIYDFNEHTASQQGITRCHIRLYGTDGELISAPRFIIVAEEGLVTDIDLASLDVSPVEALNTLFGTEQERVVAENERVNNEEQRKTAEDQRKADELKREQTIARLSETHDEILSEAKNYTDEQLAEFDFIKVVTALPEEGLKNKIYLVPKDDTSTPDLFDEYVWYDGKWEFVGTKEFEIDLSDYLKKTTLANRLYGTKSDSNQTAISYSPNAMAGTIVSRTTGGQIRVPLVPENDNEAVSKHYAHSLLENSSGIEGYEWSNTFDDSCIMAYVHVYNGMAMEGTLEGLCVRVPITYTDPSDSYYDYSYSRFGCDNASSYFPSMLEPNWMGTSMGAIRLDYNTGAFRSASAVFWNTAEKNFFSQSWDSYVAIMYLVKKK